MHKRETKEIFSTPIKRDYLPSKYSTAIDHFSNLSMETQSDEANYGKRSANSYVLDEKPLQPLRDYILDIVKDYAYNDLGYAYESYKMTQSWVSFKLPGQHHQMHSHPNGLLSGVLYFGPSEKSTPAIKFHRLTGGINVSYIKPRMRNDFSRETFEVMFEPGMLIVFPSHLHHSVPKNTTNTTRCSLAFNVVPTIGFGEEENLTELKF